MHDFMLDTNICIYGMRGRDRRVAEGLIANFGPLAISTVVLAELCFGVEKSDRRDGNAAVLRGFLANIDVLPFDEAAARRMRAWLIARLNR